MGSIEGASSGEGFQHMVISLIDDRVGRLKEELATAVLSSVGAAEPRMAEKKRKHDESSEISGGVGGNSSVSPEEEQNSALLSEELRAETTRLKECLSKDSDELIQLRADNAQLKQCLSKDSDELIQLRAENARLKACMSENVETMKHQIQLTPEQVALIKSMSTKEWEFCRILYNKCTELTAELNKKIKLEINEAIMSGKIEEVPEALSNNLKVMTAEARNCVHSLVKRVKELSASDADLREKIRKLEEEIKGWKSYNGGQLVQEDRNREKFYKLNVEISDLKKENSELQGIRVKNEILRTTIKNLEKENEKLKTKKGTKEK